MRIVAVAFMLALLPVGFASAAEPWIVYPGGEGPGSGKKVVLISGDEEYRSEELMPQLGKILAKRHGFHCTVLFAIDDENGRIIHPNVLANIPGLAALEDADLMIIATRFRRLPDDQMEAFDNYLTSGRPVLGLRTATHAFNIPADSPWAHYGFRYKGPKEAWRDGFGRLVLGETWISHHGHHKHESTRGLIAPGQQDHPVLRGIEDGEVWCPTDVYGLRLPLPEGCRPLMLGQVVQGMSPDDPPLPADTATGVDKNDPMMPIAWTKHYQLPGGKEGKVFTTTMGASLDFANAAVRRLIVGGVYWCLGMESRIPKSGVNVDLVGTYEPTMFGFQPDEYWIERDLRPADLADSE